MEIRRIEPAVQAQLGGVAQQEEHPRPLPREASPSEPHARLSLAELERAVEALNEFLGFVQVKVTFVVDRSTHQVTIRVVDSRTNEVIREVPPEEMMRRMQRMVEPLGLLLNGRA